MKVLMIIASRNFRDEEFLEPKEVLEANGVDVDVASIETGTAIGMFGTKVEVNKTINDIDVKNYDGIIFVGGAGVPSVRSKDRAIEIAKEALEKGKVLGAICWAPTILAKAGVLDGKKATVWVGFDEEYGLKTNEVLAHYGAVYDAKGVVVDGKIITADGPLHAREFGRKFLELLKKYR